VDTERDPAYAVTAELLTGIKKAFDASGIDIPFDTQVNLFHNQTEEGGT
jgi:small conductance mechanosensitive channel